jgi:hypothetical protein
MNFGRSSIVNPLSTSVFDPISRLNTIGSTSFIPPYAGTLPYTTFPESRLLLERLTPIEKEVILNKLLVSELTYGTFPESRLFLEKITPIEKEVILTKLLTHVLPYVSSFPELIVRLEKLTPIEKELILKKLFVRE